MAEEGTMMSWIGQLDEHARNENFPFWDNVNYTAGAMRATGLASARGPVLAFKTVAYARRENLIGRHAYAYGPGVKNAGFQGFGTEIVPGTPSSWTWIGTRCDRASPA